MELIGRFWHEVAKERPIVSNVSAGVPTSRGPRISPTITAAWSITRFDISASRNRCGR